MLRDYNIDPPEDTRKLVCLCYQCERELREGDEVHKVSGEYFCDYCVEHVTLEAEEPDWDSMPGGHDY